MSSIIGTTRIAEIPGWTIDQDVFGMDVLTRNFEGPAADWRRFRAAYKDQSPDYLYKDYFLVRINASSRRGEVIMPVITFKGCPGLSTNQPAFSPPKISKSLVTKQLTVRLSDGSGKTVELTYKAPSSTWTYARGAEPTAARYEGELRPFQKAFKIIKARGATQYPLEFVTAVTQEMQDGAPKYYVGYEVYNEQLDATQEGKAWMVTERNDAVLFSFQDKVRAADSSSGQTSQTPVVVQQNNLG